MKFSSYFDSKIASITPLGGGSIGSSYKIETSSGSFFLKEYRVSKISKCEALGLKELQKATDLNLPEIFYYDNNIIILNFIEEGTKSINFDKYFARELVKIHKVKNKKYGLHEDNFIGANVQKNIYTDSWSDFFLKYRLGYQVELAISNGYTELKELFQRAYLNIKNTLEENIDEPTLLHGDLWSGNVISDESGKLYTIDPAVYYGVRECDIAMTTLFGGFSKEFYKEYNRLYPLKKGWEDRVDLYNLYHILNHLNIFGRNYLSSTLKILKSML